MQPNSKTNNATPGHKCYTIHCPCHGQRKLSTTMLVWTICQCCWHCFWIINNFPITHLNFMIFTLRIYRKWVWLPELEAHVYLYMVPENQSTQKFGFSIENVLCFLLTVGGLFDGKIKIQIFKLKKKKKTNVLCMDPSVLWNVSFTDWEDG